ncbi:hypothetical protein, partial [Pseudomonas aeruginosa]|uniref:hypothetical protein n=1 Tax=Pseudomonas aeruginosa TaxID=287 RepID=UPI001CA49946
PATRDLAVYPVEPFSDRQVDLQALGEQSESMTLASWYVDVVAGRCLRSCRHWQFADRAQRRCLCGELRIRRWRGQAGGLVVLRVRLVDAEHAQD